jgi:hypothetical protein
MTAVAAPAPNLELAQLAKQTFTKFQCLEIHVNRPRSKAYVPTCPAPLEIDPALRNRCLASATPRVAELGAYFFEDLDGYTHYVTQETVDAFTRITRENFPNLIFTRLFGVVDVDTDTQLMTDDVVPQGFATVENDGLNLAIKVRTFVAKLQPTVST